MPAAAMGRVSGRPLLAGTGGPALDRVLALAGAWGPTPLSGSHYSSACTGPRRWWRCAGIRAAATHALRKRQRVPHSSQATCTAQRTRAAPCHFCPPLRHRHVLPVLTRGRGCRCRGRGQSRRRGLRSPRGRAGRCRARPTPSTRSWTLSRRQTCASWALSRRCDTGDVSVICTGLPQGRGSYLPWCRAPGCGAPGNAMLGSDAGADGSG